MTILYIITADLLTSDSPGNTRIVTGTVDVSPLLLSSIILLTIVVSEQTNSYPFFLCGCDNSSKGENMCQKHNYHNEATSQHRKIDKKA